MNYIRSFRLFILFYSFLLLACQAPETKATTTISTPIDTIISLPLKASVDTIPATFRAIPVGISYAQSKRNVQQLRTNIKLNTMAPDSLSQLFTEALIQQIIPYWYGTPWSFEGHTATPKQGEIACGYFVSTTLRDMGININRYKLAQQAPINEAKSLALDTPILTIEKASVRANIAALYEAMQAGIYFIGFDNGHVGFILKKDGQLYLIHSNYRHTDGVMVEKIEQSQVFPSYGRYYLAEISTNKSLLEKWVKGEKIAVILE